MARAAKDTAVKTTQDVAKRRERPSRPDINGRRDVLTVMNKDPDYEYRWVNDVEGRIQQYMSTGWELATGDEEVARKGITEPLPVGSVKRKPVGGGVEAVLMRIYKDWYEEDQDRKADYVNRMEKAQMSAPDEIKGGYGKISYDKD